MPKAVRLYVRCVDRASFVTGRLVMYLVLVMMALLLYASVSRTVFNLPLIWTVEMAQFLMTAYYLLGGAYSMQLDSHVRMDLLYHRWSPRTQAIVDALTICFLIFYLVFLLIGGISSTHYALTYDQRNYSAWAPPLAPIKIIMCIGITLMLLQTIATFFKNVAQARGKELT